MTGWVLADGWHAHADDARQMRALGRDVGHVLRAGDLVVLDGPLGAGKTTFVQGVAESLQVRGPVTSPTFVIARRHPGPRVTLLHVDAYRLGTGLEIDDLDLDSDVADCVTVVEWGAGKVESLGESRLDITIDRAGAAGPDDPRPGARGGHAWKPDDDPEAGVRRVVVLPVGARWAGLQLPAQ